MGQPLRSVVFPTLNALILSGTDDELRQATDLIARLDVPKAADGTASPDTRQQFKALEARLRQLEQSLRGTK